MCGWKWHVLNVVRPGARPMRCRILLACLCAAPYARRVNGHDRAALPHSTRHIPSRIACSSGSVGAGRNNGGHCKNDTNCANCTSPCLPKLVNGCVRYTRNPTLKIHSGALGRFVLTCLAGRHRPLLSSTGWRRAFGHRKRGEGTHPTDSGSICERVRHAHDSTLSEFRFKGLVRDRDPETRSE